MYVTGLADGDNKAMAFWVWLYCIFWWFIQDAAKVACYWYLHKYNIFGINEVLAPDLVQHSEADDLLNPLLEEDMTQRGSGGRGSIGGGRGSMSRGSNRL